MGPWKNKRKTLYAHHHEVYTRVKKFLWANKLLASKQCNDKIVFDRSAPDANFFFVIC